MTIPLLSCVAAQRMASRVVPGVSTEIDRHGPMVGHAHPGIATDGERPRGEVLADED